MALNSKSSRVAGSTFIAINGTTLAVKSNVKIGMGVEKRTVVLGQDGIHGFKGEFQVPFIEFTATNRNDLDLKALLASENNTVTAQQPGGKTYALRGAWQAGDGEVNLDEGEITLRFEGLSIDEI